MNLVFSPGIRVKRIVSVAGNFKVNNGAYQVASVRFSDGSVTVPAYLHGNGGPTLMIADMVIRYYQDAALNAADIASYANGSVIFNADVIEMNLYQVTFAIPDDLVLSISDNTWYMVVE